MGRALSETAPKCLKTLKSRRFLFGIELFTFSVQLGYCRKELFTFGGRLLPYRHAAAPPPKTQTFLCTHFLPPAPLLSLIDNER